MSRRGKEGFVGLTATFSSPCAVRARRRDLLGRKGVRRRGRERARKGAERIASSKAEPQGYLSSLVGAQWDRGVGRPYRRPPSSSPSPVLTRTLQRRGYVGTGPEKKRRRIGTNAGLPQFLNSAPNGVVTGGPDLQGTTTPRIFRGSNPNPLMSPTVGLEACVVRGAPERRRPTPPPFRGHNLQRRRPEPMGLGAGLRRWGCLAPRVSTFPQRGCGSPVRV